MDTRFAWDHAKAERNKRNHGISFEMAREVFADPNHIVTENYQLEDEQEQRYLAIGMTRNLMLVVVVFVDRSEPAIEIIHIISARKAGHMSRVSTKTRSVKISRRTRELYANRESSLDHSDVPQLPPAQWAKGMLGKYYRPLKSQISFRIDNDVLAWLKSKGQGHLSRINAILRERMESDRR